MKFGLQISNCFVKRKYTNMVSFFNKHEFNTVTHEARRLKCNALQVFDYH